LQITSDVRAFEDALARGAPEEAAELYAGPFLDGFFLANSTEFEQWASDQRERFANLCATAVADAATHAANAGDTASAIKWHRRAVELDPLDSTRVMRLAEALVNRGDRAGAVRALRGYQERIRRELGMSGEPEVAKRVAVLTADRQP
jgi:two-component SAPR family response regulator